MPPKVRITKNDIVKTAVELVRASGEQTINARAIASKLNCSTQPVFSNFSTMDDLKKTVMSAAYEIYLKFLDEEAKNGKYPIYKAYGMAYIRFAAEERELFKFLFMRSRDDEDTTPSQDFEASVQMIMKANKVTEEKARLMHLEMWTCVHGIATMLATSFLSLEEELISNMLTDVYFGIRARHLTEEK